MNLEDITPKPINIEMHGAPAGAIREITYQPLNLTNNEILALPTIRTNTAEDRLPGSPIGLAHLKYQYEGEHGPVRYWYVEMEIGNRIIAMLIIQQTTYIDDEIENVMFGSWSVNLETNTIDYSYMDKFKNKGNK